MPKSFFIHIVDALEKSHGPAPPNPHTDPLELILFENVAYLASDERRERAFTELKDRIGLHPADILSAPPAELAAVAKLGGSMPGLRVQKLLDIARTVTDDFDGDLNRVLGLPVPQAKKALKKFPGIGGPGADKILLFTRTHAFPAFDSNGLRVLTRVGIGEEKKDYSATYRSAIGAVNAQTGPDLDIFIKAYGLLRRHGQEICRRKAPMCSSCSLNDTCAFYAAGEG